MNHYSTLFLSASPANDVEQLLALYREILVAWVLVQGLNYHAIRSSKIAVVFEKLGAVQRLLGASIVFVYLIHRHL